MYLLLVILSAICHAVVDSIQNAYDTSIFSDKKPSFWNPKVSGTTAVKIFVFRLDADTIFGWLTLLLLIAAPVLSQLPWFGIPKAWIPIYVQTLAAIIIYIATFNIFFKRVFSKKK